MEVKQKAALIYNAIEDKKGSRISVLDISGISVMADYFVIADAENNNQLQAIADNVEEQMMKNGNHCRIEGTKTLTTAASFSATQRFTNEA